MKIDSKQFSGSCECGHCHDIDVREMVVESGAIKLLSDRLQAYHTPVLIADANTKAAAVGHIPGLFDKYDTIELQGDEIHADERQVAYVEENISAAADVLVAVGSGTVHDITRYVAYHHGIPFISVPTAASVDGFVSTVAAMTWHGMKISSVTASPVTVLADTDIFCEAPYRLTASGVSDLLGKYTALADWRIANIITGEYLCERIFSLVKQAVSEVEDALELIHKQDKDAMEKLMYALLLSGLAMQMLGNSRPASGAEHQLSHLWEMSLINMPLDALHGEKVSVGLVLCLEEYEKIRAAILSGSCGIDASKNGIETDLLKEHIKVSKICEQMIEANNGHILALGHLDKLQACLPRIAEVLGELPAGAEMRERLKKYDCIYSMQQIGLPDNLRELSLALSPYNRYKITLMRLRKLLIY
jgi:Glycerol dehydrogenase and related enzymes